jgi:hypothetical protein
MVITIRLDVSGSPLLSVDAESTSTIADTKRYIDCVRPDTGKRSPKYDLYFNGNLLKESLTLKDCGVESQSILQLSKSLQLQIRMMAGSSNTFSLSALSSDTVDGIKRRIVQTQRLPNESQTIKYCLQFLGKELSDGATLSDCKVQDGSILMLLTLISGVMCSNIELQIQRAEGMNIELQNVMKRAEGLKIEADHFNKSIGRHQRSKRLCKQCIVIALCFPCVLITECYERRRHQDELQGYTKLPGDVIKTTTTGIYCPMS